MKFARVIVSIVLILTQLLVIAMNPIAYTLPDTTTSAVTLTINYSIVGGGSPAPPIITFHRNQQILVDTLSTIPKPFIVDSNSTWAVDNTLSGSTPQERWSLAGPADNNQAAGNVTFTITYYHQFYEFVSYTVLYAESGFTVRPVLNYTQFGKAQSIALTKEPTPIWGDANSNWTIQQSLSGSSTSERWNLNSTKEQNLNSTGTVSSPGSLIFRYIHQYRLTMLTDPSSIGSTTPVTAWQDATTGVEIRANTPKDYRFLTWVGDGYTGPLNPAHVTMNGPITETAHFQATVNITIQTMNGNQSVVVDGKTLSLNYTLFVDIDSTHTITALSGSSCWFTIDIPMVRKLAICQWKFKGWYTPDGALISTDSTLPLTANKPSTIIGLWEKSYLNLWIIVGLVIIVALVLALIRRRGRGARHPLHKQILPPSPRREVSGLQYRLGALTDVGKVRSNNEDSILALELLSSFESSSTSSILCAVADGVGGSQKGEVASKLALQTLVEKASGFLISSGKAELGGALRSAIEAANEAVVKYGMEHSESEGMATTIVASVIAGGTAYVAHAGDSRAYLINRGEIKQLTKDDSQVQEWVDAGKISADQARHYPGRNVITKAVGAATDLAVTVSSYSLAPADRILLCSDGLWESLSDAEIQKIVLESSNPQSACERLVSLANERGGKDNASVIIVETHEMTKE